MIRWLVAHVRKIEATFKPEVSALRRLLKTRFSKSAERRDDATETLNEEVVP